VGCPFSDYESFVLLHISISKEKDEDTEGEPYVIEMAVPELDEKDHKSYNSIQKVIEG
jgi:hypothetical protein